MTRAEIRAAVLKALSEVAPEIDASTLRGNASLRDQIDLDSFDFLTFVVGLHKQTGVDVPERDYPRLDTLDRATEYLEFRLTAAPKP